MGEHEKDYEVNDELQDEEEINDDPQLRESRVGRSGQWGDPTEPPVVEVSFEELLELQEEDEGDNSLGDLIDTADTDGSTANVFIAMDQGLVYTPPTDPPVVPSDGSQGIEIAAGFASSIEDDFEDEELLGSRSDDDSEIEEELRRALRHNSETMHLTDLRVYVRDGVAYLRGTVDDDQDLSLVEDFISDLDVVVEIQNDLEVSN